MRPGHGSDENEDRRAERADLDPADRDAGAVSPGACLVQPIRDSEIAPDRAFTVTGKRGRETALCRWLGDREGRVTCTGRDEEDSRAEVGIGGDGIAGHIAGLFAQVPQRPLEIDRRPDRCKLNGAGSSDSRAGHVVVHGARPSSAGHGRRRRSGPGPPIAVKPSRSYMRRATVFSSNTPR